MTPIRTMSFRQLVDYELRTVWWSRLAPSWAYEILASYVIARARHRYHRYAASKEYEHQVALERRWLAPATPTYKL